VLGMAMLSGHGFQRWRGHPRAGRFAGLAALAALALCAGFAALRLRPDITHGILALVQSFKKLDPSKDYAQKLAALLGRGAMDAAFIALSAGAVWFIARAVRSVDATRKADSLSHSHIVLLFIILLADLLRVHWDHFYLFPADYYRRPPETVRALDAATAPFWRVSHYLEYPGLELWQMHNDPLAHFELLEREKASLSFGIHAIFGYRHVSAHLPLLWKWENGTTPADKSTRYLFSNRDLTTFHGDSLRPLETFPGPAGPVQAFELVDWIPRLETASHARARRNAAAPMASAETACPKDYSGYGGLCVSEPRDGDFRIQGAFAPGDTLVIRERFNPEWKYRFEGGEWRKPGETSQHFVAIPLETAQSLEMVYAPTGFYRLAGFCLVFSMLLGGFFRLGRLRLRKKP
jgi:hypothetical protein